MAKENWYSVGRLYNVNPKELAPFNNLTLAQPLIIGQTLEIPLTATNFSQTGVKAAGETLIPVIHITQEKEWMYRISVNHNKVPIPNIEKWNNVTPDQIHPGLHLVVGYLKVHTALSALATNAPASPAPSVATTTKPAAAPPPSTASSAASSGSSGASAPANSAPAPIPAPPVTTTTKPTAAPPTPRPTSTPAVTKPAVTKPAPAIATDSPTASAPAASSSVASAPVSSARVTSPPVTSAPPMPAPAPPAPHFNGGVFRADFNDGGKSASGQAGIFKSTSGWQDGKYYALMNNMTVGTIVKITDAATNKTVYAKILGQLPDMKESAGLSIRMSNAAAAELGESDPRFNVQINY